MKIIFQINGGIGKCVAATAVCKAIKTQHPQAELIVISGYPDVFERNPNVSMALHGGNLNYFFPQHIEGKDAALFLHDPYHETDFIYQRGHLIEVWCRMFDIKYNGELPEVFLTGKEKTTANTFLNTPKPILLIQTSGGLTDQADKYSWPRDLPNATAQKVVNAFAQEYTVIHIRRQDQLALQNTFTATANFRVIAALILRSEKRLFIDSFAQHTAAALGKPSVVCWVANLPSQFGYDMHTNLIANPPTLPPEFRHSVFSKYNISDKVTEFPYNSEDEIFDADRIIEALRGNTTQPKEENKKKVKELV